MSLEKTRTTIAVVLLTLQTKTKTVLLEATVGKKMPKDLGLKLVYFIDHEGHFEFRKLK